MAQIIDLVGSRAAATPAPNTNATEFLSAVTRSDEVCTTLLSLLRLQMLMTRSVAKCPGHYCRRLVYNLDTC
jgi:hypothetical protein